MRTLEGRVGEQSIASNGMTITILEYFSSDNLTVQFEDGTVVHNKTYRRFCGGQIAHPTLSTKLLKYVGEVMPTASGDLMLCTQCYEHNGSTYVDVEFDDGTIVQRVQLQRWLSGKVRNTNNHGGEGEALLAMARCMQREQYPKRTTISKKKVIATVQSAGDWSWEIPSNAGGNLYPLLRTINDTCHTYFDYIMLTETLEECAKRACRFPEECAMSSQRHRRYSLKCMYNPDTPDSIFICVFPPKAPVT